MTIALEQPIKLSAPAEAFFETFPEARVISYVDSLGLHNMPAVSSVPDELVEEQLINHYEADINRIFADASQPGSSLLAASELAVYREYMTEYMRNAKKFQYTRPLGMFVLEAVQRIASPDRIA